MRHHVSVEITAIMTEKFLIVDDSKFPGYEFRNFYGTSTHDNYLFIRGTLGDVSYGYGQRCGNEDCVCVHYRWSAKEDGQLRNHFAEFLMLKLTYDRKQLHGIVIFSSEMFEGLNGMQIRLLTGYINEYLEINSVDKYLQMLHLEPKGGSKEGELADK